MDLSTEQRYILDQRIPKVIIQAQPGSGKTRLLVEKVLDYLRRKTFRPDQIVVITFTQKAALEIKERIAQNEVWVSTIHSFCQKILAEYGWESGLALNFSILSAEECFFLREKTIRDQMKTFLEKMDPSISFLLKQYDFAKLKAMLKILLNHQYQWSAIQPLEVASESKEALGHLTSLYERILKAYEDKKMTKGSCDFDDLLLKCLNLLRTYPSILKILQKKIKVILVDEFQDTDDLQIEILKTLLSDSMHFMAVGDPKQSIYRFRGANIEQFLETKKDFLE